MIWVALAGQYDNVGDTLHRRVLLELLRPFGKLHVFLGQAPSSFVKGLELDGSEQIYGSVYPWARAAYRQASAESLIVFSPGEMQLGNARAAREFALGTLTRRVRSRGGKVARVGVAAGSGWGFSNRLSERIIRSAVSTTDVVAWREARSHRLFGRGELIPDLGFGVRGEGLWAGSAARDRLVVSMRFDRPIPPASSIAGIREFAGRTGLDIVVTSQVRRDNGRSEELAALCGGRADIWPDDRDHGQHERHLRMLYQRSALTVSDRLHALILAATEGTAVAAFSLSQSEKIPVHFATVGLDIHNPIARAGACEIQKHLEKSLEGRETQNWAVRRAFESLHASLNFTLQRA